MGDDTMKPRRRCGHCHTCGEKLSKLLGVQEWCRKCNKLRRYQSHGYCADDSEDSPCPEEAQP